MLFTRNDLDAAERIVRAIVPPTPAFAWPLLRRRTGVNVIVKHENHTPAGAFKVRGGVVYLDALKRAGTLPHGLVTVTRGNHGQSIALAAARHGLPAIIVVPEGNSPEKNAAIQAFGGELVIGGKDVDAAIEVAGDIQKAQGYHFVHPFHSELVKGVATYALELFTASPELDAVYVPIGMGSGICGVIGVRDLLGLKTEVIGVVAEGAPAFAQSFEAGRPMPTAAARTFADGLACRDPQDEALSIVLGGAARVLRVSDHAIAEAMRVLYTDTHNLAEGAGAAALAGLISERGQLSGKTVAVILSGSNIDLPVFAKVLAGETPPL